MSLDFDPLSGGPCDEDLGYCVLSDRHTRVPFDAGGASRVLKAEDGSHVVSVDATGIRHIDPATGVVTLTVPSAELAVVGEGAAADYESSGLHVVPATEDELRVAYQERDISNFRVAVKRGGAPLTLVYDHAQARCDSGLRPCDLAWTPPPEVSARAAEGPWTKAAPGSSSSAPAP